MQLQQVRLQRGAQRGLERMLPQPVLRQVGIEASLTARRLYSWQTVFDRLLAIYADVITGYSK